MIRGRITQNVRGHLIYLIALNTKRSVEIRSNAGRDLLTLSLIAREAISSSLATTRRFCPAVTNGFRETRPSTVPSR